PVRWNSDGSLTVTIKLIQCLQEHVVCKPGHELVLNTAINVELDDDIGDRPPLVENRLTSPDGKLDLVAYRYPKPGYLNPIHISIVRAGQPFPKYGNFFIGHYSGDGLLAGRWTVDDAILFRTNTTQQILSQYGFIENPW